MLSGFLRRAVIPACTRGSALHLFASGSLTKRAMTSGQSTWSGEGLTQDDLMAKDECILVNMEDKVIGHGSKYSSHRFEGSQPFGRLHRAFSVFLFDDDNRLLLQQRAKSKITFPLVWTNTCCSHPLHGYAPSEVDTGEAIKSGAVPGAKRAAVRKLEHELGIKAHQVPVDAFKYLTRLHYCAADTDTHGVDSPWGEHEIDYILLVKVGGHEIDYILLVKSTVDVAPNPEEVEDFKWVTQAELADMMRPESGLKWSPWFRIIAERFLPSWWADLDQALASDKHVDLGTIHRVLVPDELLRAP